MCGAFRSPVTSAERVDKRSTRHNTDATMPHEQLNVLLVDAAIVSNAERLIESCEHCNRFAQIPLAWILDQITGCDRSVTDYLLERPAKCPKCGHDVLEKTRIEP